MSNDQLGNDVGDFWKQADRAGDALIDLMRDTKQKINDAIAARDNGSLKSLRASLELMGAEFAELNRNNIQLVDDSQIMHDTIAGLASITKQIGSIMSGTASIKKYASAVSAVATALDDVLKKGVKPKATAGSAKGVKPSGQRNSP